MNIYRAMNRRNAIPLAGEHSTALNLAQGRLTILKIFFGFLFVLVAIRVSDLSILQRDEGTGQDSQTHAMASVKRGDIVDSQGVLLATTLKAPSLYADPHLIADKDAAAREVARIFPSLNYQDVRKQLDSTKRFVWIKRGITPKDQQKIMAIGEPGLEFSYEAQRFYPQGALLAHMIGMTDADTHGVAGLEKYYNDQLAQGETVTLNIDSRVQHILRREIKNSVAKFSAIGGMGVVMDVKTGAVVAGVSYPDYNPLTFNKADQQARFNRLSVGTYEFGSVFKIFSTAAFLDSYKVPVSTTFDASEPMKVGRYTIRDYHAENRVMTVPEVFMYSSNIGSAMMGEAVGKDKLRAFYKDLGLMTPVSVDVFEAAAPQVPNPWREITTLTASYGHGLAVTPLHVASAVAMVVNGGFWVEPKIVKTEAQKKEPKIAVMSPETSDTMRQLMRLVVTDGTGRKADAPGYLIGGKTGTAEKPGVKGYDRKRLISSFVGAFPMNDPQYVVFVAIDEPKGIKETYGYATAGWVAAPPVKNVVESMASLLGVSPQIMDNEDDIAQSLKQYVTAKR